MAPEPGLELVPGLALDTAVDIPLVDEVAGTQVVGTRVVAALVGPQSLVDGVAGTQVAGTRVVAALELQVDRK